MWEKALNSCQKFLLLVRVVSWILEEGLFPFPYPVSNSVHPTKYGNAPVVEGSKLKNEIDQSPYSASVLEKPISLWKFFLGMQCGIVT